MTNTNQYLNSTSSHSLIHKLRVVRALYNRCEYPDWAINLVTIPKPRPEKDNTKNSRKDKGKCV